MTPPARKVVRERLNTIGDPCSVAHGISLGIDDMGLVESVDIDDAGRVDIRIRLTSPCCGMIGYFMDEATTRIGALEGVKQVDVRVDQGLDWSPDMMSDSAKERRNAQLRSRGIPVATHSSLRA
jgi:metal-sulfur cluster biosynthetic enzyme